MRRLRFHLIVSGLVILLALVLLVDYGHEVDVRQRFLWNSQGAAIDYRLSSNRRILELLYDNLFSRSHVAATLSQALRADAVALSKLRDSIYRELYPAFENLHGNGFHELQLVLVDGRSFLRFRHPELFEDRLLERRPLLAWVLRGEAHSGVPENGPVYSCYRFAFPLRHEGVVVGAADFCLSFAAISQALSVIEEHPGYHQFLVRKGLFEAADNSNSSSRFRESEISRDFIVEGGTASGSKPAFPIQWLQDALRRDAKVQRVLQEGQPFRQVRCHGIGGCQVVMLRPVRDIQGRSVAYLLSAIPAPDIDYLRRSQLVAFAVCVLLILLSTMAIRRWLDSTQRLRAISDHMAEGMYVLDETGKIIYVNPTACKLLHYQQEQLIGADAHSLIHAHEETDSPAMELCSFNLKALAGEIHRSSDEHFQCQNGEIIRVSVVSSPLWSDNTLSGSVVLFRDITLEYEDKARLQRSDIAFSSLAEAVMVTEPGGEIQAVNRAFTQITGYSEAEVLSKTPRVLKSGRHDLAFYKKLWRGISQEGCWEGEVCNRRKSGEIYTELLRIAAVRQPDGAITGYVATFSDITEKLRQDQALRKLAYHDPLTGVHNRAAFLEMFDHAINHAERRGRHLALLYLDLDRFKKINDTLGHMIGDQVLEECAKRLRMSVRSEDELARLGGDEFIIMLEDFAHVETPARVARKTLSLLGQPIMIEHHLLHVTTSIGIAVYPDDGLDATSLLKSADAAMYMAKREGRNGYHYYTPAMAKREEDRFTLEIDLHKALLNEEFLLHYQPKIDLRTGKITGMEALLRWQHPERGLLTPSVFLDVAHEGGVMRDITHWVITESCRQLQEWLDAGLEPGRMAINIDSHTFNSADAYDQIGRTVEVSGVSPHRVELEIPESGLLEKSFDDVFWKLLVEMGFELSIDDFGIGESSLLRLKHLPVTTLKIDKSFVHDIDTDEDDRAIIRTVVAMGQSLGVRVLAEGVEQASQLAFLLQMGCDEAQGHLFSVPLAASQILEVLAEGSFSGILDSCRVRD